MDIKTLKAEHPDVYAEVIALGRKEAETDASKNVEDARNEGAKAENERIKAIEEISVPGSAKIIAEHKFDMTKSADQIATMVVKAQKEDLAAMDGNLNKDGNELASLASGLGVEDTQTTQDAEAEAMEAAMVSGLNGSHGSEK